MLLNHLYRSGTGDNQRGAGCAIRPPIASAPVKPCGLRGDIRHSPLTAISWPLCRVSRNTISVVGKWPLPRILDTQEQIEREIELAKEKFVFCFHALENFNKGDHTIKKEVLADLGSNREILDKKVLITPEKWLLPIYNNAKMHNEKLARLEPEIYGYDYRKSDALASLNLSWRRGRDSNSRSLAGHGFSRAAL